MDHTKDKTTNAADDGRLDPDLRTEFDEAAGEGEDALMATERQPGMRTKVHDEGSDANDTADGLTEMEESVRHAAEDIPTGQRPEGPVDSVPVFDRGELPPKV